MFRMVSLTAPLGAVVDGRLVIYSSMASIRDYMDFTHSLPKDVDSYCKQVGLNVEASRTYLPEILAITRCYKHMQEDCREEVMTESMRLAEAISNFAEPAKTRHVDIYHAVIDVKLKAIQDGIDKRSPMIESLSTLHHLNHEQITQRFKNLEGKRASDIQAKLMDMISGQIGALAPIVQFSGNWAVAIKLFLEATELSRSVLQQAENAIEQKILEEEREAREIECRMSERDRRDIQCKWNDLQSQKVQQDLNEHEFRGLPFGPWSVSAHAVRHLRQKSSSAIDKVMSAIYTGVEMEFQVEGVKFNLPNAVTGMDALKNSLELAKSHLQTLQDALTGGGASEAEMSLFMVGTNPEEIQKSYEDLRRACERYSQDFTEKVAAI